MNPRSLPVSHRLPLAGLVPIFSLCLAGCPQSSRDQDDATVFLNVSAPETVVMVAGDSATVELDITTNNTLGQTLPTGFGYQVSPDERYTGGPVVPDVAQFSVDTSAATSHRPRLALLTIDAGPAAAPGIYDYRVAAEGSPPAGFKFNPPALMRLVIIPSGGSIKIGRVQQIAAGLGHTLALLEDGTVWAWGDNHNGQLGDGTLIDRSSPVQVVDLDVPITAITAGRNHSVALGNNGRVYTWGADDRGQLGVAWRFEPPSPICPDGHPDSDHREESFLVPRFLITRLTAAGCDYVPYILEGVSAVAAGDDHTLALTPTEVVSFGSNNHGQLGDLANDTRMFVKPVQGLPGRPLTIAAAGDFSLALFADGQPWGWGDNALGQLGAGPHQDILNPLDIAFTGDVQLLAPGNGFVVARRRGEPGFISWGVNTFGQLGDGTTDSRDVPMLLATYLPISQLAAGDRHVLATLPDGTVYAWGDNGADQLGGSTTNFRQLTPLIVPGLVGMSGIEAGALHSLTRHNSCGTLWSWGRNLLGQLGQGEVSDSHARPLPVYGIGEAGLGASCEVGLRVWQRGSGNLAASGGQFGAGGCDSAFCAAPVANGTVVQITATPAEGFEFARWAGDCAGTVPSATLTLDESKNCIAVYAALPEVDQPPVANFVFAPPAPVAGQAVTFDASSSTDDFAITLYEWDFDDDGVYEATGVTAMHVFANPGVFPVHLRVTDDAQQNSVATVMIEVGAAPGGTTLTLSFEGGGSGRVTSTPAGIDCTSNCSADFAPGTMVFLSPMPLGGSVFSHWGVTLSDPPVSDCDQDLGIEGCQVTLSGNRTVRVFFE